jgi:hypothetical protein
MSVHAVIFLALFALLWLFLAWSTISGLRSGVIRGKGWSGWEAFTGKLHHRDDAPVKFWLTVLANTLALIAMPVVAIYEILFL